MKCAGCPKKLVDLSKERYKVKGNFCDDCIHKIYYTPITKKLSPDDKINIPPINNELLKKYPHLYNE